MKKNSCLYNALNIWLGQGCIWVHQGHLTTCLWMVSALVHTAEVNLTRWLPYLPCRGYYAQSKHATGAPLVK
ncbi:hypothetical protein IQ235_06895 [Oscillatoriales cyanobacterium LEGE 11467]|uniref:Uncharacterized protein n=1 Tax=Zarconia navalis LEGE 11467 TaxID=1828826 RepID=A0A928VYK4_9CYAN|nr:hypothetical protein [Zarconia navalis]MBE9040513.1 hypothetical protein [Zarconia navalis LEGE 11467]